MQTITSERVSELFTQLRPVLGERDWRLVGAAVAQLLGRGGVSAVARAARAGRGTITRGMAELASGVEARPGARRQRRPGGGRRPLTEQDPTLLRDLEALVDPTTRGDPQSGLRWTARA